jgi:hypothetical protein
MRSRKSVVSVMSRLGAGGLKEESFGPQDVGTASVVHPAAYAVGPG